VVAPVPPLVVPTGVEPEQALQRIAAVKMASLRIGDLGKSSAA
jgi:hypothetical protein